MKKEDKKRDPMPPPDATPEEIGEFWDTHNLADYWDETHEVEFQVNLKSEWEGNSVMDSPMQNSEVLVGDYIQTLRQKHKIKKSEYLPSGAIPVVDQSQDFIAGYIDDTERAYDEDLPVIVFGDHTCTLKYVDFPFAVGADGTQLIRPTEDFDIRYFYYTLRNLPLEHFDYQRHFKYLKTSKIFCPPMHIQRKIATVLSTYDNLIENNTRRIKVLEDMAQTLYQEWFVHFRFPGHENVLMVELPLGPIPQGWKMDELGNLAESIRRNVKPGDVELETPYFGLEHLPRKSIALSNWDSVDSINSAKLRFKKDEILFGKIRPYFHKVGVAPLDGICSSDMIVIRPKVNKDAEAVRFLENTFLRFRQLEYLAIRTAGRSALRKCHRKGVTVSSSLRKTLQHYLAQDDYIIFVSDSGQQKSSPLVNQLRHIVKDCDLSDRVFFMSKVPEDQSAKTTQWQSIISRFHTEVESERKRFRGEWDRAIAPFHKAFADTPEEEVIRDLEEALAEVRRERQSIDRNRSR